jgi:outer membrane protein TolC
MTESMTTSKTAILLLLTTCLTTACVGKATNRATDERLDTLLDAGIEDKDRVKAEERLGKALERKALDGLAESYDGDAVNGAESVALGTLLANALERNDRIAKAAQQINRAEAERMNAVYGYLPQVSFNYEQVQLEQNVLETDNAVFELGQAKYPVTTMSVELRQPLFDMSRIYGIQLKKTARSVAEVEYVGAVQTIMYETFDAYVSAVQSKNRMRALRERMSLVSRQIASGTALSETGVGTESETLSYRAELSSLSAQEAAEAARYASALSKLSLLSGTAIKDVQDIRLPGGALGNERNMTAEAAIASAEQNNPALLAAAISVVEGELGRKQALAADFFPVLDAFARIEEETREGSRFGGGSKTRDTTVGVRLTIPLFNARGQGYATSERVVDLRDEALTYFNVKRQLATDIVGTLARMKTLSQAIGQYSQSVSSLSANVRAERARVTSGESVDLAVLAREIAESEAREQLDFQRMEYLRAWGRLQYLTGAKFMKLGL